jgi:sterol 24-C-methyltransferase
VIPPVSEVIAALKEAGFEVLQSFDMHASMHTNHMEIPWYATLAGMEWNLTGFRMTPFGRAVTHTFVQTLELLRIAPKGSVKVSKMLNDTAIDLSNGGKLDIFSPDWFFLARKPKNAVNRDLKRASARK